MMADSRELTQGHTLTNPSEMEKTMRSEGGLQDLNSNLEDAIRNGAGKNGSDSIGHEGISLPEYTDLQFDPMLRQPYTMPAAGIVSPENMEQSPTRQYKMASDIFGTGLDRSWTVSPGSNILPTSQPNSPSPSPISSGTNGNNPQVYKNAPRSFKITEVSSNSPGDDDQSVPAGRRARESNGNPLTGHGFDPENAKTGKRYFEGSNANQKLW